MLARITAHDPDMVLDIGCGSGTYSVMLREAGCRAYLIGIEVWGPYVDQFALKRRYNTLMLADVREVDPLPEVDVVILGDVLEHMSTEDAVKVWDRARAAAKKAVYLSIPIVHYPQGPEEGNPFEAHVVDDYTHPRVLETFDGITASWTGEIVGVYEAACSQG